MLACIAVLVSAAFAPLASAAELVTTPMTLTRALALAAERHPSVLARRGDRLVAEERLDGARWQRYPQVSAQSFASDLGLQTGLNVQMPLWTAGRIQADIESGEIRVISADLAVNASQLAIMETVLSAFTEFSRARQRAEAAAVSAKEHERLMALIARRVGSEISSRADLTLAQARLGQVLSEQSQFEAVAAAALSSLEQSLGQQISQATPPSPRQLGERSSIDAVQSVAAFSPELQRLARDLEASLKDVEARRANLFPQIVARYRHNFNPTPFDPSRASVGVEYQSGAGLSANAAVREARARVEVLRLERETRAQQLAERARNDFTNAQLQSRQAENLRETLSAVRTVADSYDRQYVVGRKSWLEVLNAHREVAQTRYSLADAYWGAQLAIHRLDLLSGRLLPQMRPDAGGRP